MKPTTMRLHANLKLKQQRTTSSAGDSRRHLHSQSFGAASAECHFFMIHWMKGCWQVLDPCPAPLPVQHPFQSGGSRFSSAKKKQRPSDFHFFPKPKPSSLMVSATQMSLESQVPAEAAAGSQSAMAASWARECVDSFVLRKKRNPADMRNSPRVSPPNSNSSISRGATVCLRSRHWLFPGCARHYEEAETVHFAPRVPSLQRGRSSRDAARLLRLPSDGYQITKVLNIIKTSSRALLLWSSVTEGGGHRGIFSLYHPRRTCWRTSISRRLKKCYY